MRKITRKTDKIKEAVEPVEAQEEELVLDDAEIPFPASNASPEEVKEFFGDGEDDSPIIGEEPETTSGRIVEITFKANKNLGNQEHNSVELTSTVGENEDVEEVYNYLKDTADYLLDA